MTKFLQCAACQILKHGIKPRVMPDHTCGKEKIELVQPEKKILKDLNHVNAYYYRVIILSLIYESTNGSTKYLLAAKQNLNGYRVKAGVEIWVPNHLHYPDVNIKNVQTGKSIWVHESHYKTLAFV